MIILLGCFTGWREWDIERYSVLTDALEASVLGRKLLVKKRHCHGRTERFW